MTSALIVAASFCVLEGVALAVILSPWGQKKVVRRLIRLAQYGRAEAREILAEVEEALKD